MWQLLFIIRKIYNTIIVFFYILLGYQRVKNFQDIKNILFFKVGSIGDNIITFPMIASLKRANPNLNITVLSNHGSENLVSIEHLIDTKYIKEFINYTDRNKKELWSRLKRNHYDLVIDLTKPSSLMGTLRNMFFFKSVGLQYGLGWNISELPFLRELQDRYKMVRSEREKYLKYLDCLNVTVVDDYILGISKDDETFVNDLIIKNGLEKEKIIALIVGSKRDTNRWPIEYFDSLIRYIKEQNSYTPIIIGGKEDSLLVEQLHEDVLSFCGKLTPLQSAVFLKKAILTISNDTGPMHLSYAVGTYVVAIFSARDFRYKWYPPKEKGIVLRDEDITCRLCYKEHCNDVKCLKSIKPKEVIKIVDSLL